MFFDHRHELTPPIRSSLAVVLTPIQFLVSAPVSFLDDVNSSFRSRTQLERENAKLKAQAVLLKARLQKLLAIEEENSQLKSLLNSTQKSDARLLVAELLAVSSNPFAREGVLDKGSMEGVYVGQPVLDAYGVMGQVIAISPFTSRIMLIDDQRSGIPVEDTRSGVRAVAKGSGASTHLSLIDVPETADIKVGDVFTTSGLAQRYPFGYPVGVITHVNRNPDNLFASINLTPFAHLNRSREMILIWPKHLVPQNALAKQLMAMDKDQKMMRRDRKRVLPP